MKTVLVLCRVSAARLSSNPSDKFITATFNPTIKLTVFRWMHRGIRLLKNFIPPCLQNGSKVVMRSTGKQAQKTIKGAQKTVQGASKTIQGKANKTVKGAAQQLPGGGARKTIRYVLVFIAITQIVIWYLAVTSNNHLPPKLDQYSQAYLLTQFLKVVYSDTYWGICR